MESQRCWPEDDALLPAIHPTGDSMPPKESHSKPRQKQRQQKKHEHEVKEPEWPDDGAVAAIHPTIESSIDPAEAGSLSLSSNSSNQRPSKSDPPRKDRREGRGDRRRGTSPREHSKEGSSSSRGKKDGQQAQQQQYKKEGEGEGNGGKLSWKDRKIIIIFEVDMGDGRIEKLDYREGQQLRTAVRAFCRHNGLDIETTASRLEAHLRGKAPPGMVPPDRPFHPYGEGRSHSSNGQQREEGRSHHQKGGRGGSAKGGGGRGGGAGEKAEGKAKKNRSNGGKHRGGGGGGGGGGQQQQRRVEVVEATA